MELFDVSIVEIYGAENARPWPHQTDWQNAVEIAAMGLDLDELKFVFQTVCQKAKAQGKSMKVLSYTRYAIADVIASRQKAEAQPDAQSNPETAKSDVIAEMAEAAKMSPRSASGKLLVHFASHGMETEFRQQNARLALCADGKADLAELREWSQTELDRIEAGMRN
jgi:hypothetical protein